MFFYNILILQKLLRKPMKNQFEIIVQLKALSVGLMEFERTYGRFITKTRHRILIKHLVEFKILIADYESGKEPQSELERFMIKLVYLFKDYYNSLKILIILYISICLLKKNLFIA